jgi:hypothetical protein
MGTRMSQHKKIISIIVTESVVDDRGHYLRDDVHEWNSTSETISLHQTQLQDALNTILEYMQVPTNSSGKSFPAKS